jgi:arabinofuranosyltransferase
MKISNEFQKTLTGCFLAFFGIVLVSTSWLCDDAFIVFRTVDNFVNGYGLTWNTAERVQAYTCPLWMFLVSLFYFITSEIYYTSLLVSIGVSLLAAGFFAFRTAGSTKIALLGLGMFVFSRAFMDYSTSGLENPLTHLLLVVFFFVFLEKEINARQLFIISLIASLGMLNRMDTALLFLPCILYALIKYAKWQGLLVAGLGFIPFFLWELFSVVYYGFPFPNTAYAKLNTGMSLASLVHQGAYYFLDSINDDPVTLPVIFAGILFQLVRIRGRDLMAAVGITLYLLYVVRIGGDFMSGRFLSAPFICSVILLARCERLYSRNVAYLGVWIVLLVLGFRTPLPTILSDAAHGSDFYSQGNFLRGKFKGINNERAVYYRWTGLLTAVSGERMPRGDWADEGRMFRESGVKFVGRSSIGLTGFYAGRQVHILDPNALSEPLLARLHVLNLKKIRIGHFMRQIPPGYEETLQTGQNLIENPELALFYDRLSLVTRGKIFSLQRFREILNFNLGRYDHLIEPYENQLKLELHRQLETINSAKPF